MGVHSAALSAFQRPQIRPVVSVYTEFTPDHLAIELVDFHASLAEVRGPIYRSHLRLNLIVGII